jgi:hypothetical protein
MAGRAGATHVAGMFNVDLVVEHGLADGGAGRRRNLGTLGAVFGMGQYFNDGHGVNPG